jgi:hypothetical protein
MKKLVSIISAETINVDFICHFKSIRYKDNNATFCFQSNTVLNKMIDDNNVKNIIHKRNIKCILLFFGTIFEINPN